MTFILLKFIRLELLSVVTVKGQVKIDPVNENRAQIDHRERRTASYRERERKLTNVDS